MMWCNRPGQKIIAISNKKKSILGQGNTNTTFLYVTALGTNFNVFSGLTRIGPRIKPIIKLTILHTYTILFKVWKPDITLYNNADRQYNTGK